MTLLLFTVVCFQANAVLDMIGFPEYILNATALDDRYKDVSMILWKQLVWE